MIVIHHNDLDGICAAAIVNRKFKDSNEIKFISTTYSKRINLSIVLENETVFILDYSFQHLDDWENLLKRTSDIIWIDHHISSINNEKYPHHLKGVRENNKSGALLTWEYLFPNEKIPLSVEYINDFDLWIFEYKEQTDYFNKGLFLVDHSPDSTIWNKLLDKNYHTSIANMIDNGKIIVKYQNKINNSIIKHQTKQIIWENYKCLVVNNRGTSQMFDSIDKSEVDLLIWWHFTNNMFVVTIATIKTGIDVSLICQKYNGGGHKQIGGFQLNVLPKEFI